MSDYGIKISLPGVNAQTTSSTKSITNLNNPQLKLDTQNPKAFQDILLLITTDPPEPVSPNTDTYTVIYKFAHGYNYVPSVETLFYVKTPPPGTALYQQYFQDIGIIGAPDITTTAYLYSCADNQNVYFIVNKNAPNGSDPNLLTGTTVQISCHVFLDDIGV